MCGRERAREREMLTVSLQMGEEWSWGVGVRHARIRAFPNAFHPLTLFFSWLASLSLPLGLICFQSTVPRRRPNLGGLDEEMESGGVQAGSFFFKVQITLQLRIEQDFVPSSRLIRIHVCMCVFGYECVCVCVWFWLRLSTVQPNASCTALPPARPLREHLQQRG